MHVYMLYYLANVFRKHPESYNYSFRNRGSIEDTEESKAAVQQANRICY